MQSLPWLKSTTRLIAWITTSTQPPIFVKKCVLPNARFLTAFFVAFATLPISISLFHFCFALYILDSNKKSVRSYFSLQLIEWNVKRLFWTEYIYINYISILFFPRVPKKSRNAGVSNRSNKSDYNNVSSPGETEYKKKVVSKRYVCSCHQVYM